MTFAIVTLAFMAIFLLAGEILVRTRRGKREQFQSGARIDGNSEVPSWHAGASRRAVGCREHGE